MLLCVLTVQLKCFDSLNLENSLMRCVNKRGISCNTEHGVFRNVNNLGERRIKDYEEGL